VSLRSALVGRGNLLRASAALLLLGCTKQSDFVAYKVPEELKGGPRPLEAANNLLKASDFNDGRSVPWTTSFTAPADGSAEVKQGAYCVHVKHAGTKRWDAQFRHREMVIEHGHEYRVKFRAWATTATKARLKVGMSGPPYLEYWSAVIDLSTAPQEYGGNFSMSQKDDATAEFAFHVGGDMAPSAVPYEICVDDIQLSDPTFKRSAEAAVALAPDVAVNQLGYFPRAIKVASAKSASTAPLDWYLLDAGGKQVAQGKTQIHGADAASGERVHLVDFSQVKQEGRRFILKVEGESSYPFDIATDLYKDLKYDALAYFYHNRSGIEIAMPYAGRADLARPAGHLSDKSVKCEPSSGCDYALDVSGGWYDAGDHGKYVVNGGISLWTLLNLFERTKYLGSSLADFGDGKLAIPERQNQQPDLLDEARWQLDFMLKMQVPEGRPLSGLVHHKMHDADWTALGTAPHEDKQPRFLHKPSTAATLNLAATAAQGARIWKQFDASFAERCLQAAERAFAAAQKAPKLFAPAGDDKGGGAYADDQVADEFYWAAAELYVTTGKAEYKRALEASPLHQRFPSEAGGHSSSMNWGTTDALGMISLAVVPTQDAAMQRTIRARIAQVADRFLELQKAEGYRQPLARNAKGGYVWGSNSFVMNNVIVLALAHDFTKQQKYLDGAVLGLDYLLGRNPLAQSFVTGYGERALENPHHRFWAHQANPKYPKAPKGVLSGGPNSNIDDPYSKGAGLPGCAPAKCFVDHIEAFSVNEITINWNAPLVWAAAWLDEKGRK